MQGWAWGAPEKDEDQEHLGFGLAGTSVSCSCLVLVREAASESTRAWMREGSRCRPTVSLNLPSYGSKVQRMQRVQLLLRDEAFLWMLLCLAGPVDLRRAAAQGSPGVADESGGLSMVTDKLDTPRCRLKVQGTISRRAGRPERQAGPARPAGHNKQLSVTSRSQNSTA